MTQEEIAEQFDVHRHTVRAWMNTLGISTRDLQEAQQHGKKSAVRRLNDGTFGLASISDADTQVAEELFNEMRKSSFPYPKKIELEKAICAIDHFCAKETSLKKAQGGFTYSHAGMHLINPLFPQVFGMKTSGCISPVEIFNNDQMLRDCINRTIVYARAKTIAAVRSGLKTYRNNRAVSAFPPLWAKTILGQEAPRGSILLDFCCGFGGRLLGAYASGMISSYIGIDPLATNIASHIELQSLITEHAKLRGREFNTQFLLGTAEDKIGEIKGPIDIVMTSPPYFDKELYSSQDNQCYIKFPDYAKWISEWLEPVIQKAGSLVRSGGKIIVFASNTTDHDVGDDCHRTLQNLGVVNTYRFRTPSSEYHRLKAPPKWENAFVATKS